MPLQCFHLNSADGGSEAIDGADGLDFVHGGLEISVRVLSIEKNRK
jgi:hypothetical protein